MRVPFIASLFSDEMGHRKWNACLWSVFWHPEKQMGLHL